MTAINEDEPAIHRYAWLLAGFMLLLINHLTVVMGHPWLIPHFLRPF